jgi:hypothetical protein
LAEENSFKDLIIDIIKTPKISQYKLLKFYKSNLILNSIIIKKRIIPFILEDVKIMNKDLDDIEIYSDGCIINVIYLFKNIQNCKFCMDVKYKVNQTTIVNDVSSLFVEKDNGGFSKIVCYPIGAILDSTNSFKPKEVYECVKILLRNGILIYDNIPSLIEEYRRFPSSIISLLTYTYFAKRIKNIDNIIKIEKFVKNIMDSLLNFGASDKTNLDDFFGNSSTIFDKKFNHSYTNFRVSSTFNSVL